MTDEPVDAAASANGAVLIGLQLGPTAIDSLVALGWLAEPARADPDAIADAVVALVKNAGARSFSARASGNPPPQPAIELASDTPWGCEALMRLHESGRPLGYCWDVTILRWLRKGDVRPLAHSLVLGYAPGRTVLQRLAAMLFPDFAPRRKQPDAKVKPRDYAYRLKVVAQNGRRGRRSDNPENEVRDLLMARHVIALMEAGASYEEAIATVAQQIGGDETRSRTVRRAYDCYKPKGQ